MFYYCTCMSDNAYEGTGLKETRVINETICYRCGYYAVASRFELVNEKSFTNMLDGNYDLLKLNINDKIGRRKASARRSRIKTGRCESNLD